MPLKCFEEVICEQRQERRERGSHVDIWGKDVLGMIKKQQESWHGQSRVRQREERRSEMQGQGGQTIRPITHGNGYGFFFFWVRYRLPGGLVQRSGVVWPTVLKAIVSSVWRTNSREARVDTGRPDEKAWASVVRKGGGQGGDGRDPNRTCWWTGWKKNRGQHLGFGPRIWCGKPTTGSQRYL